MNRGDVWLAQVGRKRRPVLVLTRTEVLEVRALVTVAEITTSARGLATEVSLDTDIDLDPGSVINCDGLHTIAKSMLTTHIDEVSDHVMQHVCAAVTYAIGC